MTKRIVVSSMISIIFWSFCEAQDAERDTRRRRPRGPRFEWIFDRVARDLELDEEQKRQFDEIRAAHRERMEPFRERREAIRQARDEGNDELADQLRSELRESMRGSGGPRESMQQALDELDPILTEEQRGRLSEMRERQRERRERRRQDRNMMENLPDQLQMDESQRSQYAALMDASRKQMRERFSNMRPLFEQMREARESNDEARYEELRTQLDNMRPDRQAMRDNLLGQVESILRDDQKQQLADLRQNLQTSDAQPDEKLPGDLRTTLRAATRLRLNTEQKAELRKINADARKAWRDARRTDRENRSRDREAEAALTAQVKTQILGILDEEQTEKYREELKKLDRKGGKKSRRRIRGI